ncbi:MAG: gliding motility-associated C-terminal domain-containing protein, partial [Saprospiraceae bacterium]
GTPTDCSFGTISIVSCDDGDPNTINDIQTVLDCDQSVCVPCMGVPVDCTTGTTSIVTCDDGDACTINDEQTILDSDGTICVPCQGTIINCTTGTTSIITCDDGDPNTIDDQQTILDCDGSICIPCQGTPVDCTTGTTSIVPCDDGDICTINDEQTILDSDGTICIPCQGVDAPCGTSETCETTLPCDDGDDCTENDIEIVLLSDGTICQPCVGTPIDCNSGTTSELSCDDGDPCTIDDFEVVLDCDGSICIPCGGVPMSLSNASENDQFETDASQILTGNVLDNDVLNNSDSIFLEVISDPTYGMVTINNNGSFEYQVTSEDAENDQFVYTVCQVECPEICSQAIVNISIAHNDFEITNVFSPNGDGKNETWVIRDILLHPENKLVVVNRWGNVLYEADPYQNEWGGTNKDGKPLPEGTYYYILHLDGIGGEIIRGSITIIR